MKVTFKSQTYLYTKFTFMVKSEPSFFLTPYKVITNKTNV